MTQTSRSRKSRAGQLALATALAAILTGGGTAWAQVDVSGSNLTTSAGPYTDLKTAIDAITADTGAGKQATIIINADQTAPAPTADKPYMHLTDTGDSLTGVTIEGVVDTDGNSTTFLNGSGSYGGSVLLAIENVDGGTISIKNLNIQNAFSNGAYVAATNKSGGGLHIGRDDDGKEFNTLNMDNVSFSGNKVNLTSGAAMGGGLSVTNIDSSGATNGTATLTDIDFTNNSVTMNKTGAATGDSAIGGAARILGLDTFNYTGTYNSFGQVETYSQISSNSATVKNDSHAHGGGLAIEGTEATNLKALEFIGNSATINNSTGGASGMGNNESMARGGALFVNNIDSASTQSKLTVKDTIFSHNSAVASNSGGFTTAAEGGAVSILGHSKGEFTNAVFEYNSANAVSGGSARGGAIASSDLKTTAISAAGGGLTVTNSAFSNNTASAGSSGQALGGALFLGSGTHYIKGNTSFTNNQATGTNAKGGAIFLDTASLAANSLNFSLTGNEVVEIKDNTAGDLSNGIYVGAADGTSDFNAVVNIDTLGANSKMNMSDALIAEANNGKNFTLKKTGDGAFNWGSGRNNFNMASGSTAAINLNGGATNFASDFQLKQTGSGNFDLNIAANATVAFSVNRDKNEALFDLTGVTGSKSISVTSGAKLGLTDVRTELLDYTDRYVIVDGLNAAGTGSLGALQMADYLVGSTFKYESGQTILDMKYISPHTDAIKKAGANTNKAKEALNVLVKEYASDNEALEAIKQNFDTVTPESAMAAGPMAVTTTVSLAKMARAQNLTQDHRANQYTPTKVQPGFGGPNEGARVFGGYFGNFRNVDGDKGFYGYDQETHGALIGASYDFGYANSVGIYAGVTDGKLDMDQIKSSTDSEGLHVGVMGRFSPDGNFDPNYTIYLDAGYASYSNDINRKLNGYKATGSFDQDAFTIGAAVEYAHHLDYQTRVIPGLELRYTGLEQDDFKEKGLTATKVKGYNVDSYTSTLSVGIEHEIPTSSGSITPSARVGWQHEFGDVEYETRAKYFNPGGGLIPGNFKLSTVSTDRNSFDGGVGVRAVFDSGSYHEFGLNLNYDVNISKNSENHSLYGGLEYRF